MKSDEIPLNTMKSHQTSLNPHEIQLINTIIQIPWSPHEFPRFNYIATNFCGASLGS